MAKYVIQIDETKIEEQINGILSDVLERQLRSKYTDSGKAISQGVKDLIYSHKDEIIEKVVNRAAAELVRKGMPKLIDKMMEGEE